MKRSRRSERRLSARLVLAVVVLLAVTVVLPRPASRLTAAEAHAQIQTPTPLPTLPDVLGSPKPSPSPSKSPEKEDEKEPEEDDKKNERGDTNKGDDRKEKGKADRGRNGKRGKGDRGKRGPRGDDSIFYVHPTGDFTTDTLVAVAANLRALGWPTSKVTREVFAPFIIAGNAAWTNTWGAPRYGPGPIVRTHEGQDVFCDYGAPVLASEEGVVEFAEGGLGGKVARLYRSDGSYWYYAHLSEWNTEEFVTGDLVVPGDVIGYCGNTGNALTTPPHVHFGWYQPNGDAKNPFWALKRWLRTAEDRAARLVVKETGERVQEIEDVTLGRRFGDTFAPDLSELRISGESLWGSGSYPGSGAFLLAEAALQAALAEGTFETASALESVDLAGEQAGAAAPAEPLLFDLFSPATGERAD